MILKHVVRRGLQRLGYDLHRREEIGLPDADQESLNIIRSVQPYTVTSSARIYALCEAVRYVTRARIPGAIVECGVWEGGSMMAVSMSLRDLGDRSRELYLFDTFEGMTPPSGRDVDVSGNSASTFFEQGAVVPGDQLWRNEHHGSGTGWAAASHRDVQARLEATGYPSARLHLVPGRVEETVPEHAPDQIALLRLDTDWYESTAHEMKHLFPRLVVGGVLIIDDYGHWQGARDAVDEYLRAHRVNLLLHRIDYTARAAIMTEVANRRVQQGPGTADAG